MYAACISKGLTLQTPWTLYTGGRERVRCLYQERCKIEFINNV